jgi:ATP-binding cassette subfamily E protein 1
MVIEHDLIILDYLTDMTYIMYGQESVYGVVSQVKTTKAGINIYLSGYLKEENIRFRDKAITFESKTAERKQEHSILTEWESFEEKFGNFSLKADKGEITQNTIVGILGENGIGKTTFVKILAGEIKDHKLKTKIAYKPQYLEPSDELVMNILQKAKEKYQNQLITPLKLEQLYERQLNELSGGELQRVAIANCLSQDADLFLLDEPSAYLDVEQRLSLSKLIKDILYITGKSALIVDHDLLFIDYLSDNLIVFEGEPAIHGEVKGPFSMEQGMNNLLQDFQITFRRDEENKRPRANKQGSQKDQEQKKSGKLYYT